MNHPIIFTFNPFQENTYLIISENKECIIIDPGCSNETEFNELNQYILNHNLIPKKCILTHAHIDHILGCAMVYKHFGLVPDAHILEKPLYKGAPVIANMYNLPFTPFEQITFNIEDNLELVFNEIILKCIHAPGHSPGSICFYNENEKWIIGGDVLFNLSIGRTDLPMGNHQQLLNSIKLRIFSLPEDVIVYPGHGTHTTIGFEKNNNPYL